MPKKIEGLPDHLLVSIFRKMPNVPVVRMRQTCSRMDAVVEANRQQIALRPTMGMKLDLNCCAISEELIPDLEFRGELTVTKDEVFGLPRVPKRHFGREFEADFDKKFSGLAISNITIVFNGRSDPAVEQQLLSALRRARLVCDTAAIAGISPRLLAEMVNLIDCKGKMSVQMKHEDCNDETVRFLLEELKTNPKHHNWKPTVKSLQTCSTNGLFELLKPFRAAKLMDCTASTLNAFVLDVIGNSASIGHLEKISAFIWSDQLDIEEFRPWEMHEAAPFTVLWEIFLCPPHLMEFEFEIPGRNYLMQWEVPRYIRLVELENHYLINIEFFKRALLNENFFFLPKDEIELVKFLSHHLRKKKADKLETAYLGVSQEFRPIILAKVFAMMAEKNLLREG